MARGLAKVQAQEKHAKKMAKTVAPVDGKAARASQLKYQCVHCKVGFLPLSLFLLFLLESSLRFFYSQFFPPDFFYFLRKFTICDHPS
jgi:hypothetical protein